MKKFKAQIGSYFKNPEKADIILFTHHHADHCYPSSFANMRSSTCKYLGPEKCKEKVGSRLTIIEAGDEMEVDGVKIRVVDAYNIKRRRSSGSLWHPKGIGVGFLITLAGLTIYHSGDTESIPEMKEFGHIDLALLPIGDKFTMSIEESINVAKIINPKFVIPMHNHESKPSEFKKKLEAISNICVIALEMGEIYDLTKIKK